jgi:hypothetical protein
MWRSCVSRLASGSSSKSTEGEEPETWQRDALLLSAGKLRWIPVLQTFQPNELQHLNDPVDNLTAAIAGF